MGTPKALIDVDGRPAAIVMADRLSLGGCHPVDLVAPADSPESVRALATLTDPGVGPVGAIREALRHASTPFVLVVAVDQLGFAGPDVRRLLDEARDGDGAIDVFVAGGPSDVQWLIGVWRRSTMLARLDALVGEPNSSVRSALRGSTVSVVPFPDSALLNVNTPEDLRLLRESE